MPVVFPLGWPVEAVKPPSWVPYEYIGATSGLRRWNTSPLMRYRTWAARAHAHLDLYGPDFVDGYRWAWHIHGRR
jgi:hypothetical protein